MRTSETTIPPGIAANKTNCWELIDLGNGLAVDDHGDGIRHFDSLADADSWAEDTGVKEKGAGVEPREMSAPCWLVTAICGWVLDDELPMQMHHATAEEALRAALDNDMRIGPSGGLICDPDCDDCKQGSVDTRPYVAPGTPDGVPDRAREIAETMPTVGEATDA